MQLFNLFLVLVPAVLAAVLSQSNDSALLLEARGQDPKPVVLGKYIVVFRSNATPNRVAQAIKLYKVYPQHVFDGELKGFAAALDEAIVAALGHHPDVAYIERDSAVSAFGTPDTSYKCEYQSNATWGLARMSSQSKDSSSYGYRLASNPGAGTCSYIIDTGIDDKHPDFEGRAKQLRSFVKGQQTDGHGHGTHSAGIIGGRVHGVAKKTKLFGVKVLDDQAKGQASAVIAGMNFVARHHKSQKCPKGVIVNVSAGLPYSKAVNEAAAALVRSGAFLAVAAGNQGKDAAGTSPASEKTVCTVAAADRDQNFASFSNRGKSVDVVAPGLNILSAMPNGQTGFFSGTSTAAPHVAGLAAYLGAKENIKGGSICRRIVQLSTKGLLNQVPPDTVNALAFNGIGVTTC